jgi:hypothetical protein
VNLKKIDNSSLINLFEIRYSHSKKYTQDPGFIFYDALESNNSALREYPFFLKFANGIAFDNINLYGLFSPRFNEKTKLSSNEIKIFLNDNPGMDIYLFHPYPYELSITNDFLKLADLEHPGIVNEINKFWNYLYNKDAPHIQIPKYLKYCCHCNYFVANGVFWKKYKYFINKFSEYCRIKKPDLIFSETDYNLSLNTTKKLPMLVFVFERLLTFFLVENLNTFSVVNYMFSDRWDPPELFDGEAFFVQELRKKLLWGSVRGLNEKATSIAVEKYFNLRKSKF